VSFLSDYGHADEFVGVCKAVMLGLAPDLTIVDISHEVPPHDVRSAALTLVRAVQYLPDGLVLAVVDPGVGTDRRAVAIETESGILLGPDNGLLAPAVAMIGGATRAVSLTPGLVPLPNVEAGALVGEVWWVDRFGNCQLNMDPEELGALGVGPGAHLEVRFGGSARQARWVHTYADAKPSELVLLVDSYGLLALVLDRKSAAIDCGLRAGSAVTLVPPGGGA